MSITLHPRHEETTRAGLDIQTAVIAASTKYGLTFAELVNILAVVLTSWSKSAVIAERVVALCTFTPGADPDRCMCGKHRLDPNHTVAQFDPAVAR